jgi:hypothetical protein
VPDLPLEGALKIGPPPELPPTPPIVLGTTPPPTTTPTPHFEAERLRMEEYMEGTTTSPPTEPPTTTPIPTTPATWFPNGAPADIADFVKLVAVRVPPGAGLLIAEEQVAAGLTAIAGTAPELHEAIEKSQAKIIADVLAHAEVNGFAQRVAVNATNITDAAAATVVVAEALSNASEPEKELLTPYTAEIAELVHALDNGHPTETPFTLSRTTPGPTTTAPPAALFARPAAFMQPRPSAPSFLTRARQAATFLQVQRCDCRLECAQRKFTSPLGPRKDEVKATSAYFDNLFR